MRFKSIIGAFLFVLLASTLAFFVVIHTRSFGTLLTKVITDIAQKKFGTQVAIRQIGISVFPPGLELHKVSVDKKISDTERFSAEFGSLGFYIGLIELEEKRLSFGEIKISDSVVNYTSPDKNEEIKEIDQALIDEVFKFADRLPIRIDSLIFLNTNLILNHDLLEAKRIKFFKKSKSFIARFHLGNIRPSSKDDFKLDEVWGDIEIDKKNLSILRLKVQHDVHSVVLKGKIQDYRLLKKANVNVNGQGFFLLKNLHNLFRMPDELTVHKGFANIDFSLNHDSKGLNADFVARVENLDAVFLRAQHLESRVSVKQSKVVVSELFFRNNDEEGKLVKPVEVADLNTHRFLEHPLEVEAKNVSLENALGVLGPDFKILKGHVSGRLTFNYVDRDMFFTPHNGFHVHDFRLVVGSEKPFQILAVKNAKLQNTEFSVIKKEFQMRATLETGKTYLEADGFANKNEIRFTARAPKIDLWDLGNLANLDIKGLGNLDLNVRGSPKDTSINLKGKMKGFEILGYRLGQTSPDITIDLKDSNVVINQMDAVFRNTKLTGNGVVNYDNSDIALGIETDGTNYADVAEILHPIFKKLNFLPEDLNFNAKLDVSIFGKTRASGLKIKSGIVFSDLMAYGEILNSGNLNLVFEKDRLYLNDIDASKDKGDLQGHFLFDTISDELKFKFNWENLKLSTFNLSKLLRLNIDGKMSGSATGAGPVKGYSITVDNRLFDTHSSQNEFEDSVISLKIGPSHFKGKANFFGQYLTSVFDIYLNSPYRSTVELKANINEIKPLAIAFFGEHLEDVDLSGTLNASLTANFFGRYKDMNLRGEVQRFKLDHPEFKVDYASTTPQFVIQHGKISTWNLKIQQPDLFLMTKGNGNVDSSFYLQNDLHFNSKILEILFESVLSADGFIRNLVKIEGDKDKLNFSVTSKSSDLNLSLGFVPFPLNNVKYSIDLSKNRLIIHELSTNLDNGTVALRGDVFLEGKNPDINLSYVLDKAEIPVFTKSSVNVSGEGTILGNHLPYMVNGDIVLNRGQIINELSDFNSKSIGQVRYLPRNQESILGRLFNLNVGVKAENPLRITNSMMDVALKGSLRVFGSSSKLKAEGHVSSPANSSRVFFKNSEYLIQSADINFNTKKEITNPDFDVQTMTLISNYKVFAKAYGDLERFNFDLTSDPPLPRNSILSLIAFGYTDDIQTTLTQGQQQSLSQVGVGSFVFDRFKISDILNKQFGLQINMGTFIDQNTSTSMLSGRTNSASVQGTTRSATRIELKKRLDEALTVSVSSTMGAGIGNRQNMTLTYGLNQKVSVQGVYEIRTNEDGEENVIDNSIGGDLIFRWTYK